MFCPFGIKGSWIINSDQISAATLVGYQAVSADVAVDHGDSFWDFWGADSSGSFDVWAIGSSSLSDSGTDATVAAN